MARSSRFNRSAFVLGVVLALVAAFGAALLPHGARTLQAATIWKVPGIVVDGIRHEPAGSAQPRAFGSVGHVAVRTAAQRMEGWIDPENRHYIYPSAGTPTHLDVEVRFCSEDSYDEEGRTFTLREPEDEEGVDVTDEFSWDVTEDPWNSGCEYEAVAEGEVPISPGVTTIEANVCDSQMSWCANVYGEYTVEDTTGYAALGKNPYAPPNAPPTATIPVVSAVATTVGAPSGAAGVQQRFLVRNRKATQRTFKLKWTCEVPATCNDSTNQAVAAGADLSFAISHSINGSSAGQTGRVRLSATDVGDPGHKGIDSVHVLVGPSVALDTVATDLSATRARALCVMVAAGGGASQCGDLVIGHALPSVRVLGTTRTPTLVYNSATAHPMVLIPVNVAFPSGASAVTAKLTMGTPDSTIINFGSWTAGQVRRLVVGRDGSQLATGVHSYSVELRRLDGSTSTPIKTVSGEIAIVNRAASPFGAGWWLAGLEELEVVTSTKKLWIGGDGSTRIYTLSGGVWRGPAVTRADSMITLNGDTLCRKLPGGACVVFDGAGKHIATRGRLSMTGTNAWGFRTNFTYSGARLSKIIIPHNGGGGDTISFSYGNNGGQTLSSVTAPAVPGKPRSVVFYATGARIDSILDPDSLKVRLTYGASTLRVSSHRSRGEVLSNYQFDAGGKLSQVAIPANATETITTALQALESRGYTGTSTGTPITAAQSYTLIDGPRTDVPDSTLIWLNSMGAPRRVRDALGHETALTHSATWPGLVTKVEAPNGFVTEATYDSKGRLATQTAKNPYGWSPAQDAVTRYVWNSWDAVDSIISPLGPATTFGYDATSGNRIWQQVGSNSAARVNFNYYASGHHAGLLRNEVSPTIAADSLVYDAVRGNLAEYLSPWPKRYRTTYAQDAIGRVTVVTAPLDTLQTKRDSAKTTYDVMDRVIRSDTKAPDHNGVWQTAVVETGYDGDGRVVSVTRSSIPDDAGVGELLTEKEYDWAGRTVAELTYGAKDTMRLDLAGNVVWTKTRRGHEITMRHDALGRMLERVVPGVSYDHDVTLSENGTVIKFPFYPNNNRGLLLPPEVTQFWYDHTGNVRLAINADAKVERSYFPNGQLQTDILRIWSADRSSLSSYTMSHAYDLAGRDTSFTYPGTTGRARYSYHDAAQGQLAQVIAPDGDKFGFAWNLGGQLVNSTVTPSSGSLRTFYDSLNYDSQGAIKTRKAERTAAASQTGWSGRHTATRYNDPRGRLLRIELSQRVQEDPSYEAFTYSGLGATVYIDKDGARGPEAWYTDALGHRVWGKVPDPERAGDIEMSSLKKHYSYVEDRLASVEAEMPGVSVEHATYPDITTYDYDAAGNLVHELTDMRYYSAADPWDQIELARKKMRSYYAADQRLRVVQKHDATYDTANVANVKRRGTFEEYRYDPLGRRVLVIGKAQSDTLCNQTGCSSYQNRFVWNGDHLIWEQYRGNTNVYVNGLGIDRPLKIRNMIPHADYRGVYDAGNQATGQAISANYPGRNFGAFHDEGVPRLTGLFASVLQGGTDQSGLAYRRNRYYDPATGRFTQQDPIGIAGGLNLYGYANGDPVNFSDPFGLSPCCVEVAPAAAVATAGGFLGKAAAGAAAAYAGPALLTAAAVIGIGYVGYRLLRGNDVGEPIMRGTFFARTDASAVGVPASAAAMSRGELPDGATERRAARIGLLIGILVTPPDHAAEAGTDSPSGMGGGGSSSGARQPARVEPRTGGERPKDPPKGKPGGPEL